MSILFFTDPHLGWSGYSLHGKDGLSTATDNIRQALEAVCARSSKDDIKVIICGGDFFHSKNPTTENIRWTIEWLSKMDSLNKPFYIIPGNHDVGLSSHSLVFIKSLVEKGMVRNVKLVEEITEVSVGVFSVHIVPFVVNSATTKNRYESSITLMRDLLTNLDQSKNNIVVAHLSETDAKFGSEMFMVAPKCDSIDLNEFKKSNPVRVLFGHIHAHQVYIKDHHIVCYAGSLTYLDKCDCNTQKGYILVSDDGTMSHHQIPGVRRFKQYILDSEQDVYEELNSMRFLLGEVVFLKIDPDLDYDENKIRDLLNERGCYLGKIDVLGSEDEEDLLIPKSDPGNSNPFEIFNAHLKVLDLPEEKMLKVIAVSEPYIKNNFKEAV